MMKPGHVAVAAPLGLGVGWIADSPTIVTFGVMALTMYASIWNDWDHPRLNGREYHIGAASIRTMCKYGHRLRTKDDRVEDDYHRGFTHCIEWCILVAAAAYGYALLLPAIASYAPLWGIAVLVGTISHIVADCPTHSGVPGSAIYNVVVHRQVWKRHSLHLTTTNSGSEWYLLVPICWTITSLLLMQYLGFFIWFFHAVTNTF